MGLLRFLFSSDGRINRAKLWLFLIVALAIQAALVWLYAGCLPGGHALLARYGGCLTAFGHKGTLIYFANPVLAVVALIETILVWAIVAVTVKRLHDRDKSAAWLWVFWVLPVAFAVATAMVGAAIKEAEPTASLWILVPAMAAATLVLWGFIDVYCMQGTIGANRFGPDPIKRTTTREDTMPPAVDEAVPEVSEDIETKTET